jgi:hypothetical protein
LPAPQPAYQGQQQDGPCFATVGPFDLHGQWSLAALRRGTDFQRDDLLAVICVRAARLPHCSHPRISRLLARAIVPLLPQLASSVGMANHRTETFYRDYLFHSGYSDSRRKLCMVLADCFFCMKRGVCQRAANVEFRAKPAPFYACAIKV